MQSNNQLPGQDFITYDVWINPDKIAVTLNDNSILWIEAASMPREEYDEILANFEWPDVAECNRIIAAIQDRNEESLDGPPDPEEKYWKDAQTWSERHSITDEDEW